MKSVVICGSRRFKPEIRKFAQEITKLGVVVFEPYLHSGKKEWENLSDGYKKFVILGLTHTIFIKSEWLMLFLFIIKMVIAESA